MSAKKLLALPLALFALSACGDSPTGGGSATPVAIRFGVGGPAASLSLEPGGALAQQGDQLTVTGANGTLAITDLRMIVAEFEVKGDDDVNPCEQSGGVDDCEDFEAGPLFVDVPLSGNEVTVSTGEIPPGTYREVEFEVEDLDDDEDEPSEAARIQALLQQVRAQFNDWPRDASMLVVGTFTPTGGQPRPFRVFIEAEIEVEVNLAPPLVIDGTSASRDVSILLNLPSIFRVGGNVLDLSQSNGRMIELEVESGFSGRGGSNSGQG